MAFSLYLLVQGKKNKYFFTEELKKKSILFRTKTSYTRLFTGEQLKNKVKYFFTPSNVIKYFFTDPLDIDPEGNICIYPKELDIIRSKAILLYYKEIKKSLKDSVFKESYGKICKTGYNISGMSRLLLDYLSSIWIERDNDSRSGLVRTSDFYYTKYSINDIIVNFRECGINIKPVVALFNLNSYTIIDNEWPNYFMMDKVINPPEDKEKEMKQWTDIFTLQSMTPDRNQAIKSLSASQTSFIPTKNIKYFSAFTINGVDYTGYTDYNANSVTYSPSIIFGYNIESNDTVIITYWYEE
jgi:hypothetical protein